MLAGMRVFHRLSLAMFCLSTAFSCSAQHTISPQLASAAQYQEQGQPQAVIALLATFVESGASAVPKGEMGIAWNLLGTAYQEEEQAGKAVSCYEEAIRMLKDESSQQAQYASAIDNLGSVELSLGEVTEAKKLRVRAHRIYRAIGNREGVARTSSNLAVLSLAQGNLGATGRYVAEAFREAQTAAGLSGNDWAAMYMIQGRLASAHRDMPAAIGAYRQGIERWSREYGTEYFKLGWGYTFLGQAEAEAGNTEQALSDLKHAMEIEEKGLPGRQGVRYLQTEIVYARTLRATGLQAEAASLEAQAETALAELQQKRCNGCRISVESLR